MRKVVTVLTAGLLTVGWTGVGWPGEEKDARGLVAKAIQAAGGEAKLAKFQSASWKESGTYYGLGDGLTYTGSVASQWPDKLRVEVDGVFVIVVDKDKGWTRSGGETKDMGKDELALQHHNRRAGWITTLLPLKDKAFDLKVVGDDKVDEQATRVVQVTRKQYPDVKLYFATKTGLLVKSEFRTKAPEQKFAEVVQTAYYSDHRDVEGAKVPHKIVVKRDGKVFIEEELSEMKAGMLDAKTFARPSDD